MALTTPQLPRATVGGSVTAQAWNELLAGIDGFSEALATAGSDYVQVNVAYRQGPVAGARVVGVPVAATGGSPIAPPVQAAPDGGAGSRFRLPVIGTRFWKLYVEAPGFATSTRDVEITAGGPDPAIVSVELGVTHRFVPDVAGFASDVAQPYLRWFGFAPGALTGISGARVLNGTVVLQGPAAGTAVPLPTGWTTSTLATFASNLLLRPPGSAGPFGAGGATRTFVPDLVGLTRASLGGLAAYGLVPGASGASGDAGTPWIVRQDPPAGEVVAVATQVQIAVASLDPAKVTLAAFDGTHRLLARAPALQLANWISDPFLNDVLTRGIPWSVARWRLDDRLLGTITEAFRKHDAPVSLNAGEGLAEAWRSLSVANRLTPPG